jgi:hypothetical protein
VNYLRSEAVLNSSSTMEKFKFILIDQGRLVEKRLRFLNSLIITREENVFHSELKGSLWGMGSKSVKVVSGH